MGNMPIRTFIERFDKGDFDDPSVKTQCEAGWYDWFCKDSNLAAKTKGLGRRVKQIADSPLIDQDKMYVFFKNNFPMDGPLYDSFSICDIATMDVVFWVAPKDSHAGGKSTIWGNDDKGVFGELYVGSWLGVKNFFKQRKEQGV